MSLACVQGDTVSWSARTACGRAVLAARQMKNKVMVFIGLFVFLALLSFVFPQGVKYFIAVPICGSVVGGSAWCVAAIACAPLITLTAFGSFVVGGIVLSLIVALLSK